MRGPPPGRRPLPARPGRGRPRALASAAPAAFALFAALAPAPTGPAVPPAPADPVVPPVGAAAAIARFEAALARDVVRDSVGSIAAAVVVDGAVAWEAAFGWADRDRRTLATPATLYRVGSISKTVTALVLMRLVDEGVVGLDDPVEQHLPELRRLANLSPDHPPITFRQLASHTAGLAREPGTSFAARGPFRGWKRKLVAVIPTTAVLDPPGARYRYSNIGYALLGLALERAADRPFELLAQDLVFDPLGMRHSFLAVPARARPGLATGYVNPAPDSIDPRVPRAEHRGRGYKVPNGGVYSTVGDLARLIVALSDPPPLGHARAPGHRDHAPGPDDSGAPGRRRRADVTGAPGAPGAPEAPSVSGASGAPGDGRLLPERLRRRMLTDQTPRDGGAGDGAGDGPGGSGYGIGLQLQRVGDTLLAGHSGAVAGYTAYLVFDPATATGVVLLRNYNRGATNLGAAATALVLDLTGGPSTPRR